MGPKFPLGTNVLLASSSEQTLKVLNSLTNIISRLPSADSGLVITQKLSGWRCAASLRAVGTDAKLEVAQKEDYARAATGIARTSSGIYDEHRESKVLDNSGKLKWAYNSLRQSQHQMIWSKPRALPMLEYFGDETHKVISRPFTYQKIKTLN
ncbi:hypothetical protein E4U33_005351 [Claviceps sp. LM78 group G4]|nr:hypothetical protein E4U33_005351 [Claviceps sp. LM78 group G4]